MTFDQKQIEAMNAPLDPKNVQKPSGSYGPKGDYLFAWHVINEANRIFGFDGWSYTHELKQVSKFTNQKDNIEVGYICTCTVTVGNVTRQDIGYGSGANKKEGDAHEGAVKEAVSDALKRCLRTFGNPFGLALYDKTQANVCAPKMTDSQMAEITTLANTAGVDLGAICDGYKVSAIIDIPKDKFDNLKSRLSATITAKEKAA